jgi:hypothetical protein
MEVTASVKKWFPQSQNCGRVPKLLTNSLTDNHRWGKNPPQVELQVLKLNFRSRSCQPVSHKISAKLSTMTALKLSSLSVPTLISLLHRNLYQILCMQQRPNPIFFHHACSALMHSNWSLLKLLEVFWPSWWFDGSPKASGCATPRAPFKLSQIRACAQQKLPCATPAHILSSLKNDRISKIRDARKWVGSTVSTLDQTSQRPMSKRQRTFWITYYPVVSNFFVFIFSSAVQRRVSGLRFPLPSC